MEQDAGSSKNSMYLIRKRKSDKGRLIVFAEVTEEKLSPALMTALSGIVCLVDPLQVEALRNELETTNIVLPPLNGTPSSPLEAGACMSCSTAGCCRFQT